MLSSTVAEFSETDEQADRDVHTYGSSAYRVQIFDIGVEKSFRVPQAQIVGDIAALTKHRDFR